MVFHKLVKQETKLQCLSQNYPWFDVIINAKTKDPWMIWIIETSAMNVKSQIDFSAKIIQNIKNFKHS